MIYLLGIAIWLMCAVVGIDIMTASVNLAGRKKNLNYGGKWMDSWNYMWLCDRSAAITFIALGPITLIACLTTYLAVKFDWVKI